MPAYVKHFAPHNPPPPLCPRLQSVVAHLWVPCCLPCPFPITLSPLMGMSSFLNSHLLSSLLQCLLSSFSFLIHPLFSFPVLILVLLSFYFCFSFSAHALFFLLHILLFVLLFSFALPFSLSLSRLGTLLPWGGSCLLILPLVDSAAIVLHWQGMITFKPPSPQVARWKLNCL